MYDKFERAVKSLEKDALDLPVQKLYGQLQK